MYEGKLFLKVYQDRRVKLDLRQALFENVDGKILCVEKARTKDVRGASRNMELSRGCTDEE